MNPSPQVHKFSKFIHGTCTLFPELVQAVPYWVDDESVRPSMLLSAPPGEPRGAVYSPFVSFRGRERERGSRRCPRRRVSPAAPLPPAVANGTALLQLSSLGFPPPSPSPQPLAPAPTPGAANNGPSTSVQVVTGDGAGDEQPLSAKPRKRTPGLEELQHPLLGDEPTLKLLPDRKNIKGGGGARARPCLATDRLVSGLGFRVASRAPSPPPRPPSTTATHTHTPAGFAAAAAAAAAADQPWWYKWLGPREGAAPPRRAPGTTMMRIEPKTFFANERTFLSWLHMSVTIGRCARARGGGR